MSEDENGQTFSNKVAITVAIVWDDGKGLITTVGELAQTALGVFNTFVLLREEGKPYYTAINPRYIRSARVGFTPEMIFEGEDLAKIVSMMTTQTLQSIAVAQAGGTSGVRSPASY